MGKPLRRSGGRGPGGRTEIVVFVTTSTEEEAARISRTVVDARLAACANIIPRIRSIYRWEGKAADENEALVILKTRGDLFQTLEREVKRLHTYKTPEIIALPIQHGSAQYLEWIHAETSKPLK
jgi:periplasmic divalent cation tolerance protein